MRALVMGVNSHPVSLDANGSVGFYMDSTLETFAEDFSAALRGEAIENNLPRLRAIIDSTSGNRYTTDRNNELLIANTINTLQANIIFVEEKRTPSNKVVD